VSLDRTTLGIFAMLGFAAIAPGMDAFAKATPAEVPVGQLLAFRFTVQAAILLPLGVAFGDAGVPRLREGLTHVARALAILGATGLFFAALRHMPMTTAIAIFFVEPFVVTLLGAVVLGEPVGRRRVLACVVGFGGALLVIQPSFSDLGWPALYPLGTATLFALYVILTRHIAGRRHPVAVQGWTAFAAAALVLPTLVLFEGSGNTLFDAVRPSAFAWVTLMGVGLMSTLSHLALSVSLRLAPASHVAPFQYFEIVSATTLGLIFFGDFPNRLTWAGIAVIVGSGIYLFARERVVQEG